MQKIKILVVDDHPMMREAILTALSEEEDMQVVGEASNGFQALHLYHTLFPDLVLMDLLMPEMDGLQAITAICQEYPNARILVVTSLEDEDKVLSAIRAGALGYFPKTAPRQYLLEGIRKVAAGVPYLPSGIALKLFNSLRSVGTFSPHPTNSEPLTARQEEVLVLLGEGKSDVEIAKILHIQESTIRSHLLHILMRLGLETRAQAIVYANRSHRNP